MSKSYPHYLNHLFFWFNSFWNLHSDDESDLEEDSDSGDDGSAPVSWLPMGVGRVMGVFAGAASGGFHPPFAAAAVHVTCPGCTDGTLCVDGRTCPPAPASHIRCPVSWRVQKENGSRALLSRSIMFLVVLC